MARRRIIAGNWKMNKTPAEAVELCNTLKDLVKNDDVDVVYCVPAIDIVPVVEAVKGTNVKVGAENFYIEDKGAFTGEISAPMLKEAGVEYIIIGHSERRDIFGENDILINAKVKKAISEMTQNAKSSAEAVFGIHEKTNRVTIKMVDKETKKVIKEFPPDETLDMIAKVWEIAGIMVDE